MKDSWFATKLTDNLQNYEKWRINRYIISKPKAIHIPVLWKCSATKCYNHTVMPNFFTNRATGVKDSQRFLIRTNKWNEWQNLHLHGWRRVIVSLQTLILALMQWVEWSYHWSVHSDQLWMSKVSGGQTYSSLTVCCAAAGNMLLTQQLIIKN